MSRTEQPLRIVVKKFLNGGEHQAAFQVYAAVRVRGSRFRALFLRVMAKKGKKTAYVVVARKMLTVVWHLLIEGEMYVEDGFEKTLRRVKHAFGGHVPLDEMADVLRSAGHTVANG